MADHAPLAVVIGAGGGLGRSLALRFAREGLAIALVGRSAGGLTALATEVERNGVSVVTAAADAADPQGLAEAVSRLREHGPITVLAYNAAMAGGRLSQTDLAALRRASDVNLHAPILATQAALPDLRAQSGTVLLTGGGLALYPDAEQGVLSLGKAAIRAAALILAADLADVGVKVRTVTIGGLMERGGPFDPDRVADAFWGLHSGTSTDTELVYTGA